MLIAIDHGNKQMKTVCRPPFVSGLAESTTKPFGSDVLMYENRYYTLSNQRIPYKRDKTEDDRFFILTLFGIAQELQARGIYGDNTQRIQLAVGLPPAHYGAQNQTFIRYFSDRGVVKFTYKDRHHAVYIDDVRCYPQAYAAAATMMDRLMGSPRVLIVDIGGFTADYLMMRSGRADLAVCDSLENGVIVLYNQIRKKANSEFDILLDETDIDGILEGKADLYAPDIVSLVEQMARNFVNDLANGLRERMLDLSSGKVVFVGGGAIRLRRQIESSGKVRNALFVEDINANAKGYEFLYRMETRNR
ncbi:MAG: ParM/StbA family protein [Lachnospiraceae bacterium]|nr:ParM/StbA family protein [Lachnospiraceae bacterium]MBD5540346.1 ParM/StbA family protein [Lachnospiraceae bacterium]MBD5541924.1 ParM/StbA family protein [Lachnospiraceae bacterium]